MRDSLNNGKIYSIRRIMSMLVFAVILVFFYYADESSSKATATNETFTRWNSENDSYKKIELDGQKNGYILSDSGKICYYKYDQGETKDERGLKDSKTQDDELLESGTIMFDSDCGWTYEKKTYGNGELKDKSVKDNSYKKTKFPFQSILQKGIGSTVRLEVFFYSGNYELYGPFKNYSFTTIEAADGEKPLLVKKNSEAVFVNVDDSDSGEKTVTGYNGSYGFHLKGLDFDLNGRYSSVVKATHAMYYTIEDCSFHNGKIGHVLEFNAMKYVNVEGCKFEDINYNSSGEKVTTDYINKHKDADKDLFVEVVQIEGDSSEQYRENTPMGKYSWTMTRISNDNTTCSDVVLKNNAFKGVVCAIGHHYYNDESYVYQNNIDILNNTFENITDNAICLYGYKNVNIKDNYFRYVSDNYIGGARIFLKGCVDKDNKPYTNDYENTLASQNTYYSIKYKVDRKLSELKAGYRQILIYNK